MTSPWWPAPPILAPSSRRSLPANVMLRQLNPHLAEEVLEVRGCSWAKCWREIIWKTSQSKGLHGFIHAYTPVGSLIFLTRLTCELDQMDSNAPKFGAFFRKCHDHVAIIPYHWRCFLIPIKFQSWQGTALLFPSESLELHHSLLGLWYMPMGLLSFVPEGEEPEPEVPIVGRLDTFGQVHIFVDGIWRMVL